MARLEITSSGPSAVERQIGSARHLPEHAFALGREPVEGDQVLAVDLERQGRTHTGNELLHPHLDRLRSADDHRGDRRFERFGQTFLELARSEPRGAADPQGAASPPGPAPGQRALAPEREGGASEPTG